MTARAVIIGAGGYTGAELARIILRHPGARVAGLFASARRGDEPRGMHELFPEFRGVLEDPVRPIDLDAVADLRPEAVFLATPHEASVELAGELVDRGLRVFDLSGAFRLKDPALYPRYYGFEHGREGLLERAVYGLAELFRERIAEADLVAVPGCYPTSAILPLAPLAEAVRAGTRVIVDSVSGASGAGRSAKGEMMFCEVSLRPYGIFTHRHGPEIGAYSGAEVVFTPHVGPYDRGIVSTIHVELAEGWDGARVGETLEGVYGREPFVRLLGGGSVAPATEWRGTQGWGTPVWPSVGAVRGTNFCDIAWAERDGHLIVCSAIDNLVKGAAGQAVQCMNIRLGLPETAGLLDGS